MEYTSTLPELISLVPASYHVLNCGIEGRLGETCKRHISGGGGRGTRAGPWQSRRAYDVPTKNRIATKVSKFFALARTIVRTLQITSMVGICSTGEHRQRR